MDTTLASMDHIAKEIRLRTQRGPPVHFAGRHEELALLNDRLDILGSTGDPSEGMALVIGVPGAGKTQLGRKFVEDASRRDGDWGDWEVKHLLLEPDMLNGDIDLFLAMGEALGFADQFRAVAEIDTRITSAGGGLGPAKANMTQEHIRHTGEFPSLLRKSKNTDAWAGKVLIVVVDELQGVQPDGMDALRSMHQGMHGCPILLVGIGLQHTERVLANPDDGSPGISRVNTPIRLESLSIDEAEEAIGMSLNMLGHPVSASAVQALAEASHGFPKHVHGYIYGAIKAIGQHGHLDSRAAIAAALAVGDDERVRYYNARLRTLANRATMLPVVKAMCDRNTVELTKDQAIEAIATVRGGNGEAAVDEAIHRGVLTENDEGDLGFSIPSFHSHMVRLYERERQRQERERDLER